MKTTPFLFTVLFLSLLGCTKPTVSKVDLVQHVSNGKNKLDVEVVKNGYKFLLKYVPATLLAANELADNYDEQDYREALMTYSNAEHFILTVSNVAGETQKTLKQKFDSKYDSVFNELAFNYGAHIKLKCGKLEIPCSISHLESDGNIRDGYIFVLGFETTDSEKLEGDRTVIVNDKIFTDSNITLTITEKAIDDIPNLVSKQ